MVWTQSLTARRRRALIAGVAMALLAMSTAVVIAVTPPNPGPFTGCLAGKTSRGTPATKGQIYNIAQSATTPLAPCLVGDSLVTFSNAMGPKGDKGDTGDPGTAAGIVRVRYDFDVAVGALPPDTFSQTQLEHGAIFTPQSAILTLSAIPAACVRVDVWARVFYTNGTGVIANWLGVDTTGGLTGLAPSNLGSADTVSTNPHPLTGFINLDAICFDADANPMNPDVTPSMAGSLVFQWNHAPVLIP